MPASRATGDERQRLDTALKWLKSHRHRLELERKSLERQLGALSAEIDRVADEIRRAETRRDGSG